MPKRDTGGDYCKNCRADLPRGRTGLALVNGSGLCTDCLRAERLAALAHGEDGEFRLVAEVDV